jgi:hypothetical protein
VAVGWRKLHNKELHNLYSYLNVTKMIKSRKMMWAGNTAGVEGVKLVNNLNIKNGLLGRSRSRWRIIANCHLNIICLRTKS